MATADLLDAFVEVVFLAVAVLAADGFKALALAVLAAFGFGFAFAAGAFADLVATLGAGLFWFYKHLIHSLRLKVFTDLFRCGRFGAPLRRKLDLPGRPCSEMLERYIVKN